MCLFVPFEETTLNGLVCGMKNVLIVSYYYLPMNNGGVERIVKYVKYLPQFGYKPIVTTVKMSGSKKEDNIYSFIDKELNNRTRGGVKSLPTRLRNFILFKLGYLIVKDSWCQDVLDNIDKVIFANKPDLIFATYPPLTNLTLGVEISKRFNLPLVTDFRDGLVFEGLHNYNIMFNRRSKQIEQNIVNSSSYVVTATEPISEYFKSSYSLQNVTTITNGFDIEDWKGLERIDLGGKINIVYTGRISYSDRNATIEPLLIALKKLSDEEKKKINIYMVGEFSKREKNIFLSSEFNDIFKLIGFVSREEALRYQISADILLLITGNRKSVATGKLFEYLAASKPIFAITAGTVAEDIIKKTGTGLCVNPDDSTSILEGLRKIILTFPDYNFYHPNKSHLGCYSRKKITEKLSEVFNLVLTK